MGIIFKSEKGLIKKLRSLGGEWTAKRKSFGTYSYHGKIDKDIYELNSYAHFTPRFDGDDDSFTAYWHIIKNGKEFMWPSEDPVFLLKIGMSNEKDN